MKRILGLDLGTNSIGWALTNNDFDNKLGNIEGLGSRIIPMAQDAMGIFESGAPITTQTAQRTEYRGKRRLVQRFLLRRERMHRVLNILGFLPKHYSDAIDFDTKFGQFKPEREEKLSFYKNEYNKNQFLFMESHQQMLSEFNLINPDLKQVPYDWTIYYLRKKALTQKISKEELAWILLIFNQKRGYYQLRGEEKEENKNKLEEFHKLTVVNVIEREKGKSGIWYNLILENGWIYKRESKIALFDWVGKQKDFIVTTELNDDGTIKLNKDNEEKRSFRSPKEDDWGLVKIRTEQTINQSGKSVGSYIYDELLKNPNQKIKGELVRTIERHYYKSELKQILETQIEFHSATLKDGNLYEKCINDLYKHNDSHKNNIKDRGFDYLFIDDIIFYQRPLKSKTSLISDCSLEFRPVKDKIGKLVKDVNGIQIVKPLKCIAKSNPIFQEFRLLQFVKNLKIFRKDISNDVDVTNDYLKTEEDVVELYNWLNDKAEVSQKQFLAYQKFKLKEDTYRWNFVEDKIYSCNETRNQFLNATAKTDIDQSFFDAKNTQDLWHILYSVTDKTEIAKAITTFAQKHNLPDEFVVNFSKIKPYKKDYGSYSEKAIKKLLTLMRRGENWNQDTISDRITSKIISIKERLESINYDASILEKVSDSDIPKQVLKSFINCTDFNKGLNTYQASYLIYDRHSEASDISKWKTPSDIEHFLKHDFTQHSLRNPIVQQVITETLRVVKDIWQHYGEGKANFFNEIHIELGREMKNNAADRKRITETINKNENTNLRIKAILTELKNDGISDIRPYSPSQQEILKIYEEGIYSNENSKEKIEEVDKIRKNAKPTTAEINKYKLWLEQGYLSPYTGQPIMLSDLFTTKYQIEHIIPQSRLFDDSLSNKVICESEVNELKSNMTALEFILKNEDRIVTLTGGKTVKIFTKETYNQHITSYYSKNKSKQKRLLSEDIPEKFIERQLNDTKYISKIVRNLLSKIVRDDDEQEVTSKHIVTLNGSITSRMKQDWGLNDVWNKIITPRFERLNAITNSSDFGKLEFKKDEFGNTGKQVFQTTVPDAIAKGFSKKRIDHRHHALDALVIACVTKDHVNYLNSINSERTNYSLVSKLRRIEEIQNSGKTQKVAKEFHKPWENFTKNTEEELNKTIISFKQNTRVINKTVNKYVSYKDEKGNLNIGKNGLVEKKIIPQTKGDNWAIRKPMHAETVSGKVFLKRIKQSHITIANAIEQIDLIVDKEVKKQLVTKIKQYPNNDAGLKKHLKAFPVMIDGKAIDKIQIYETVGGENGATATRKTLDITFDEKRIEKITDTGIQKILLNHLKQEIYQYAIDENGEKIPAYEIAFSENGLDELNKNITTLNNGKKHQPIKKVRVFEEGSKFSLGQTGNKVDKYVEAAKGTNLFFAIYQDEKGKRNYKTIPFNEVIERQKQGLSSALEIDENGNRLLFTLSPNDLVYIPTNDEKENLTHLHFDKLSKEKAERICKFVSCTGGEGHFVSHNYSKEIISNENGSNNKSERILEFNTSNTIYDEKAKPVMIKSICWKLEVDRLGKIKKIIR